MPYIVGQLKLQDQQNIMKAFERGASFSNTPEAVFALAGVVADNTRNNASNFVNQMDNSAEIEGSVASQDGAAPNATGLLEDTGEPVVETDTTGTADMENRTVPEKSFKNKAWDQIKDCIPCEFRFNFKEELENNLNPEFDKYLEQWKQYLTSMAKQIANIFKTFDFAGTFGDICPFLKLLKDFVCLPDLHRIIAILMALLTKLNLQFGSFLDIFLGMIGMIFGPFLSGLLDLLMKYIGLVVRPIECIINSLQAMINKVNFKDMLDNLPNISQRFSTGIEFSPKKPDTRGDVKVPYVGTTIGLPQVQDTTINTRELANGSIKRREAANQRDVEQAQFELQRLQSKQVEGSDQAAIARHRQQLKTAKDKYDKAKSKADLDTSSIGSALLDAPGAAIGGLNDLKSIVYSLVGMLKAAVITVETFFNDIFDEFSKLMKSNMGGGGGLAQLLATKQAVMQMVDLITSLIKLYNKPINCNEDATEIAISAVKASAMANGIVSTNPDGSVEIRQSDQALTGALQGISIGFNSGDDALRKLNSLIKWTNDKELDNTILEVRDKAIKPQQIKFKCNVKTSAADAEKIRQWIEEVNTL